MDKEIELKFSDTLEYLKKCGVFNDLKKMVKAGKRNVFDIVLDALSLDSDDFSDCYVREIDQIGHDLLWGIIGMEAEAEDSVEDQIRRLEEEIKALKERKEDDLK